MELFLIYEHFRHPHFNSPSIPQNLLCNPLRLVNMNHKAFLIFLDIVGALIAIAVFYMIWHALK